MDKTENIFVFVVCGAREHIDSLHFSLISLRRFSCSRILIITDPARNEIPVVHEEVIAIRAPTEYDHHQASIYLKTGLHKFLPKGNNYCYLDTDVVALDDKVDQIFSEYRSPITFCTDHCVLEEFSPSAIYCGCMEAFKIDSPKPYYFHNDFYQNVLPKLNYIDNCINEIEALIAKTKSSKLVYQWHTFKYSLPGKYYHLNDQYKMDKALGLWYDQNGTLLSYPPNAKDDILYVSEKTGFSYDPITKQWSRQDGTSLTNLICSHLIEKLDEKFGIRVSPFSWQHWNGGVFLFNDDSADFLDHWHRTTMDIFKDKAWRTRDQGTLAATVWHFGLQDHPTLPLAFNLIADFNNKNIEYCGELTFRIVTSQKIIKPHFIHIYHHWGDTQWHVWRDVAKHIKE